MGYLKHPSGVANRNDATHDQPANWRDTMSYDPLPALRREIDQIVQGGQIPKGQILNVFRLIRLTLEANSLRAAFPTCAMYCDWLQHTELDRNPGVLTLIEAIDSIFSVSPDKTNYKTEMITILNALGLVALRHELLSLFGQFSLPLSLLTSMSNWYGTVSTLIEDLVGRPLIFTVPPTSRAGKESLARIISRRQAAGRREYRHVYKVVISDERTKTPKPGRPAGFYFTIFLSPSEPDLIQINAHWTFQEGRDAFVYD